MQVSCHELQVTLPDNDQHTLTRLVHMCAHFVYVTHFAATAALYDSIVA